jgi:hypothetical protein
MKTETKPGSEALWYLRLSQWRRKSSVKLHHVGQQRGTKILEESAASLFRINSSILQKSLPCRWRPAYLYKTFHARGQLSVYSLLELPQISYKLHAALIVSLTNTISSIRNLKKTNLLWICETVLTSSPDDKIFFPKWQTNHPQVPANLSSGNRTTPGNFLVGSRTLS